jgi:hypothetical protein
VTELVAERVDKTQGRMSAKRMLPIARAADYDGSARNFRRRIPRRIHAHMLTTKGKRQ